MTEPTPRTGQHEVHRPDDGEYMGAFGLNLFGRLLGHDTRGAYSLFEYVVPPGAGGPPTHIHSRTDELFICITGSLRVELDGAEHLLTPGASLLLPRGVPHMFDNPSDEQARIIAVASPPGLEDYYRDFSQLPPGRPDLAKVSEIMDRHGLSFV